MRICRDIANGSKHFSIDPESGPYKKHPPIVSSANMVQGGYGVARYGRGVYGVGESSYRVFVGEEQFNMLDVASDTIVLFGEFFAKCDI